MPLEQALARRPPLWWELPIALSVFFGCIVLSGLSIGDKQAAALRHAEDVLRLERAMGLDVELSLNRWLARHDVLATITSYAYAWDYVFVTLAVLVYLYVRRPAGYRWARNSCIALNVIAATCFALYPVAPPRLVPNSPFTDVVSGHHVWGSWGSAPSRGVNQFAAMPSLHFALALWAVVMLMVAAAPPVVQLLAGANVVVTLVVIVATGNHYLLDATAALVVTALSVLITAPRRRRQESRQRRYAVAARPSSPNIAGVAVLDQSNVDLASRKIRQVIAAAGPRWRQRLERHSSLWPPRWSDTVEPDWSWHIAQYEPLTGDGDLRRLASMMMDQPLPADRPPWRAWLVPAGNPRRVAVIVVVNRALERNGWLDTVLKATAIRDDGRKSLDAVLNPLTGTGGH